MCNVSEMMTMFSVPMMFEILSRCFWREQNGADAVTLSKIAHERVAELSVQMAPTNDQLLRRRRL